MKYTEVTFDLAELIVIFAPFLDRLVKEHANKRQAMIDYHLVKLDGLTYTQIIRKMPRGPSHSGAWSNLLYDIRLDLKGKAQRKAS